MSTGKLKAQYNRVRTSVALQGNDMWSRTIGIESEKGTNSAIEAQIRAPEIKGGGRQAKREAAQALLKDFGMEESICDYAGLLKLAKAQGNVGHATRGACKICGQLGHLTKQCKNYLSEFYQQEKQEVEHQAAVAQAAAEAKQGEDDLSELSGLSDLSDSDDERRSKKKRKASGYSSSDKHRKEKSRSKSKHRKEKKHKSKSKSKSRKEKRSRSSDSD